MICELFLIILMPSDRLTMRVKVIFTLPAIECFGYTPPMQNWKTRYLHEVVLAQAARAAGNEGKARVCARHAAGILIGEYLQRQGLTAPSPSAHARLRFLAVLPDLPPAVQELSDRLLMRVDEDFTLPAGVDLLADVQHLAGELDLL